MVLHLAKIYQNSGTCVKSDRNRSSCIEVFQESKSRKACPGGYSGLIGWSGMF